MDFSLLISTFLTVFLAELGDKTQLATVAISGTSNRPLAVFLGSSSALVLASLLGAFAGGSVANVIPSDLLQLLASLGFLGHIYDNLESSRPHFEASRDHFGSLEGQSGITLNNYL